MPSKHKMGVRFSSTVPKGCDFMIGIYKIENKINHKVYIGQSINIERRWRQHKRCHLNHPLYNSFKKYGIENFTFEVLIQSKKEKLNELELYYIQKYNSTNNSFGYNQSITNSIYGHSSVFTCDLINDLFYDLSKNQLTKSELARKYNCSERTIRDINLGKVWFQDNVKYPIRNFFVGKDNKKHYCGTSKNLYNKCKFCGAIILSTSKMCRDCLHKYQRKVERPSKEELEKLIQNNSIESLGRKFGVSGNAIRKWKKYYNI